MISYVTIIFKAAKMAQVSGTLLYAICSHESSNFTLTYNHFDGGSPSIGICQVKLGTAQMLGYKGTAHGLMNAEVNAKWAAKYLKYQSDRYNNDCMAVSAYNAGSYVESTKSPGHPRNLKYIRFIQKKLDNRFQYKLTCN